MVCIFAEGAVTRTGNLLPFKRGMEKIVKGLDAPIIPVHIDRMWGSIFSFERGRFFWKWPRRIPYPVTVSFGAPMASSTPVHEVREAIQELSAEAIQHRKTPGDTLDARFIRNARRHWNRLAIADSTGRELTYGRTLTAATMIAWQLPEDPMIGVLLPAGRRRRTRQYRGRARRPDYGEPELHRRGGRDIPGYRGVLDPNVITSRTIGPLPDSPDSQPVHRRPPLRTRPAYPSDGIPLGPVPTAGQPRHSRLDRGRGLLQRQLRPSEGRHAHALQPAGEYRGHGAALLDHSQDRIVGVLPLFHSFGFTVTIWFPLRRRLRRRLPPQSG